MECFDANTTAWNISLGVHIGKEETNLALLMRLGCSLPPALCIALLPQAQGKATGYSRSDISDCKTVLRWFAQPVALATYDGMIGVVSHAEEVELDAYPQE